MVPFLGNLVWQRGDNNITRFHARVPHHVRAHDVVRTTSSGGQPSRRRQEPSRHSFPGTASAPEFSSATDFVLECRVAEGRDKKNIILSFNHDQPGFRADLRHAGEHRTVSEAATRRTKVSPFCGGDGEQLEHDLRQETNWGLSKPSTTRCRHQFARITISRFHPTRVTRYKFGIIHLRERVVCVPCHVVCRASLLVMFWLSFVTSR